MFYITLGLIVGWWLAVVIRYQDFFLFAVMTTGPRTISTIFLTLPSGKTRHTLSWVTVIMIFYFSEPPHCLPPPFLYFVVGCHLRCPVSPSSWIHESSRKWRLSSFPLCPPLKWIDSIFDRLTRWHDTRPTAVRSFSRSSTSLIPLAHLSPNMSPSHTTTIATVLFRPSCCNRVPSIVGQLTLGAVRWWGTYFSAGQSSVDTQQ